MKTIFQITESLYADMRPETISAINVRQKTLKMNIPHKRLNQTARKLMEIADIFLLQNIKRVGRRRKGEAK